MKESIVFYYSLSGSNYYLANKIAEDLNCPIEEIRPMWNIHLLLLMGLHPGNRKIKSGIHRFDRVIIVGPIWMGKVISPLKSFVRKYRNVIDEWVFVSCCGSGFEVKDKKFGHGLVFEKMKDLLGDKCRHCEAFPISLVLPEDQREDGNLIMNTRLNEDNFKDEILDLYNAFILKLKEDRFNPGIA
jgi:flavodoxin